MPKPIEVERLDRHSGTGVRGLPKKGGLKGWGKIGEEEPVTALDENDPNFEESEDVQPQDKPIQTTNVSKI